MELCSLTVHSAILRMAVLAGLCSMAYAQDYQPNIELMNRLAGDPFVNVGTDNVLTELPAETAAGIDQGRRQYVAHCAVCHGSELQGQANWQQADTDGFLPAPPHDASGHTWHHADDQLFEIVKYGAVVAMGDEQNRSRMPGFQSTLTDEQILSILVYIRSTWPEQKRQWQAGVNVAQTGVQWWRKNAGQEK